MEKDNLFDADFVAKTAIGRKQRAEITIEQILSSLETNKE